VVVDFSAGLPDLALFPRRRWARATHVALETTPDDRLGYGSAQGLPELRAGLVDYLGRVRGVSAAPDDVVICNGFSHGITVLADALGHLGHRDIGVEDPHRGAGNQLAYSSLPPAGTRRSWPRQRLRGACG
jgi:GntR family transcriptional regulator/MocR family aminotransferase